MLAKELAEGATEGVWGVEISIFRGVANEEPVQNYLVQRWADNFPNLGILISNGYLSFNTTSSQQGTLTITKAAFDLVEEVEQASIFISYKRSESSAFALLVLARLKMAGLEPFLDLSLIPGEDWQQGLRERIQQFDYLIAILGKDTLASEVCQQEMNWALEAGLSIIPIWHNGFKYESSKWTISAELDAALCKTHTIRVVEESALAYNNAIVELLNRFGVTP
jgi:hypothetical protein